MPKQDMKKAVWGKKKNAIMRAYRKMQKGKKNKNPPGDRGSRQTEDSQTFFERAMSEYERRKAYREEKKKAIEAKRKEREEALRKYEQKKRLNFKKLSQKTKWGQPVMKGRMEILLERIERTVGSSTIK